MGLLRELGTSLEAKGVRTLGLFRDHSLQEMIEPFIEDHGVSWPIARDPQWSVLEKLGVGEEDHYCVVLLDREGSVAARIESFGAAQIEELRTRIETLPTPDKE